MRILGSKNSKVERLITLMRENVPDFELLAHRGFYDVMSGIGTVSEAMLKYGNVYANDNFYPFYLITQFQLQSNFDVYELNLLRKELNELKNTEATDFSAFFSRVYGQEVPYFTYENARKIAMMRDKIEQWKVEKRVSQPIYEALLGMLLAHTLHIAATRLTFDAPVKQIPIYGITPFTLPEVEPKLARGQRKVSNLDYRSWLEVEGGILYLDPPAHEKQYSIYYHLLETLTRQYRGVVMQPSGKLQEHIGSAVRSEWSKKGRVWAEFNHAIQHSQADVIVMTYSRKGLLSRYQIEEVLRRNGNAFQMFSLGSEMLYIAEK